MRYSGPPPGNGSSASASSSSGRTVGVTVSSSGAVSAGSSGAVPGGAMLYRQSVPAATAVRSAAGSLAGAVPPGAASGSTFQRSMMVAGFEEDSSQPDLGTDYQYSWAQENYSKRRRNLDSWSFVLTLRTRLWLLDQKWSYSGGQTAERRSARARTLAVWIREQILQLGPTYIKIGQLFSTRSDLFPPEFTEELSKLQDRVPAFSADKAEAIIERELGAPVSVLFRDFDRRPIAAASLGQVHRATLHTGESVVVKVQRPGLRKLFDIDLEVLGKVAEALDRGDEATRDFKGIYKECAETLYAEIDYIAEGRNADRFRRNFREQPWVKVPRVYWQHCSPSVLTLEYAPGVKITDITRIQAAGLDAPAVARRATEAYLLQILRHGFFHADPHPGNIAVDGEGALIFYDFGMMGEIVPATRERLVDLFQGVAQQDTDAVVRELVALGIIVPTSDLLSIRRSIQYFIQNINRQAQQQEAVGVIGEDLFAIAVDQPFRFPAAFTFVLRAFATLEGIGKALDPDFKFATVAAPYATELLNLTGARSQSSFLLEQLQQQATDLGQAAAAMPGRVQKMDATLALLESGDLKLRVRVLEAERAARRAGVIQAATLNTIVCMGTLNVAVQLGLAGYSVAAGAALAVSAGSAVVVGLGMRRVKRLDKFEISIKTGQRYDPNA
ncbi:putative aarF domain-containing kinase chloroplastic [Micractinium conductrix]|uniref:AarF domain-containing kinase chloroplastic n=1 Tax=Micractinium conductrix TaxID=554055 RepID=A0A2P6UZQ6_9CHLO|nr:putative aarF domain-containing kinase chloroplastic [Micractinium conductrix]|eukprot:PSC67309.1 putative aarF domain-containing kinase chloroplastic [Micractinium conductrix]